MGLCRLREYSVDTIRNIIHHHRGSKYKTIIKQDISAYGISS